MVDVKSAIRFHIQTFGDEAFEDDALIEACRLVVHYAVAGAKVHDARLVAAMLVHGVPSILTLNDRDFARYSEVSAVHPRAIFVAGR